MTTETNREEIKAEAGVENPATSEIALPSAEAGLPPLLNLEDVLTEEELLAEQKAEKEAEKRAKETKLYGSEEAERLAKLREERREGLYKKSDEELFHNLLAAVEKEFPATYAAMLADTGKDNLPQYNPEQANLLRAALAWKSEPRNEKCKEDFARYLEAMRKAESAPGAWDETKFQGERNESRQKSAGALVMGVISLAVALILLPTMTLSLPFVLLLAAIPVVSFGAAAMRYLSQPKPVFSSLLEAELKKTMKMEITPQNEAQIRYYAALTKDLEVSPTTYKTARTVLNGKATAIELTNPVADLDEDASFEEDYVLLEDTSLKDTPTTKVEVEAGSDSSGEEHTSEEDTSPSFH